jgi:hypothetical protein
MPTRICSLASTPCSPRGSPANESEGEPEGHRAIRARVQRRGPLPALRGSVLREVARLVRRPRARGDPGRGSRRPRERLATGTPRSLAEAAHGGRVGRRARTPFTLYRRGSWWWVQFRIKGKRCREPTACSDRGAAEARAAGIWQEAKARAGEPAVGAVQRSLKLLGDDLLARVKGHGRAETYARDLEVDLRLHILPLADSGRGDFGLVGIGARGAAR